MRCTLLLPMSGVGLSVTNALNDLGSASLCRVIGDGACCVCRVECAWGHLVQPLPNTFGLVFNLV